METTEKTYSEKTIAFATVIDDALRHTVLDKDSDYCLIEKLTTVEDADAFLMALGVVVPVAMEKILLSGVKVSIPGYIGRTVARIVRAGIADALAEHVKSEHTKE